MGIERTKKWLEDNDFLDREQMPIEIKNSIGALLKNVYYLREEMTGGERGIVYIEDFSYSISNPLLQGNTDREKNLEAAYKYAVDKDAKFFFLSRAFKEESNYPWGEDIIISFEPVGSDIRSASRFKPIFDKINSQYYDKATQKLSFNAERFKVNESLRAMIINTKDKGKEFLKIYLSLFDSRAFQKNVCIVRLPVLDETPNLENSIEILPHNLLVYGAPGTGKSYLINQEVEKRFAEHMNKLYGEHRTDEEILRRKQLQKDDYNYSRVTFYEDYTYEAFVGCYKPQPKQISDRVIDESSNKSKYSILTKKVSYEFVGGPFINILIKALNDENNNYYLIIEELNRANAASVFGDMFQLLDRDAEGKSIYEITPQTELMAYLHEHLHNFDGTLRLPRNLYIWATMNSADQGVFPLDSAFKRRWSFYYKDLNTPWDVQITLPEGAYSWESIRNAINTKMMSNNAIDEDRCIGAHFFSEKEIQQINSYTFGGEGTKINPFIDKLVTYLRQDVFRNNPQFIFRKAEGMTSISMSEIRKHYDTGKILDIFNIDEAEFKQM